MMRVRNNRKKGGQAGFVQTAELLLIMTVLGLGLITGFSKLRDQTLAELSDTGDAIGSIDQSYRIATTNWKSATETIAVKEGFQFADDVDGAGALAAGNVGGDGGHIVYAAAPTSAAE